jgi:tryptophanyl-tRNA synthetase
MGTLYPNVCSGRMLTNDVKQVLIDVLTPLIMKHRHKRAEITDEIVKTFMSIREIKL